MFCFFIYYKKSINVNKLLFFNDNFNFDKLLVKLYFYIILQSITLYKIICFNHNDNFILRYNNIILKYPFE